MTHKDIIDDLAIDLEVWMEHEEDAFSIARAIADNYDLVPRYSPPTYPDLSTSENQSPSEVADLYSWSGDILNACLSPGSPLPQRWVFDTPEDIVRLLWAFVYAREATYLRVVNDYDN